MRCIFPVSMLSCLLICSICDAFNACLILHLLLSPGHILLMGRQLCTHHPTSM